MNYKVLEVECVGMDNGGNSQSNIQGEDRTYRRNL